MLRNLTILYMEYLGVGIGFEYIGEVLSVGVGNENLAEVLALHHLDDALHTFAIEAVEDIIEQQYWSLVVSRWSLDIGDVQSLCQFHREDEGALLPLRADLLERVLAKAHVEVIFMNALRGPAEYQIALAGLAIRFA